MASKKDGSDEPRSIEEVASLGGKARSKALTKEERSEIARKGGLAKAAKTAGLLKATHSGPWTIGHVEIQCAVLDDGTRLLTQEGMLRALGRAGKAKGGHGASGVDNTPAFFAAANLKPFISEGLMGSTTPIVFLNQSGSKAFGYRAELLSDICWVFINAQSEGRLTKGQQHIAERCKMLVRAFGKVGIIALIDEATGYQADRTRDALAKILEKFIAKELRPWIRTFPAEFYEQMYRLRLWEWKGMSINRTHAAAGYTKDLVYARLAPGVLEELRRIHRERAQAGKPKAKMFQSLTEDIGHPKLKEHLSAVVALMRVSASWDEFMAFMDRSLPKYGETLRLLPPDPPGPKLLRA